MVLRIWCLPKCLFDIFVLRISVLRILVRALTMAFGPILVVGVLWLLRWVNCQRAYRTASKLKLSKKIRRWDLPIHWIVSSGDSLRHPVKELPYITEQNRQALVCRIVTGINHFVYLPPPYDVCRWVEWVAQANVCTELTSTGHVFSAH